MSTNKSTYDTDYGAAHIRVARNLMNNFESYCKENDAQLVNERCKSLYNSPANHFRKKCSGQPDLTKFKYNDFDKPAKKACICRAEFYNYERRILDAATKNRCYSRRKSDLIPIKNFQFRSSSGSTRPSKLYSRNSGRSSFPMPPTISSASNSLYSWKSYEFYASNSYLINIRIIYFNCMARSSPMSVYILLTIFGIVVAYLYFSFSKYQRPKMASSFDVNLLDRNPSSPPNSRSIFEFSAYDIDDNIVDLKKYAGKVTMLDVKYRERGLQILAFPCNQFGGQEPGDAETIKNFIKKYNVEFDMFHKIDVNGKNAHPLFSFLKNKKKGTLIDAIKWNFSKFLCDKDGIPIQRYAPQQSPKKLIPDIEKLLNQ
ncbi:hypothetical protein SNEBB_009111 [Seison nebaliae]|nr:hypothetical protein SNEBB_009111 [Seison nebaliae]